MKQAFLTTILALSCAASAVASDYTSKVDSSTVVGGDCYGFFFKLEENYESDVISNSGSELTQFTDGTKVSLDTIEFTNPLLKDSYFDDIPDGRLSAFDDTTIKVYDMNNQFIGSSSDPVMNWVTKAFWDSEIGMDSSFTTVDRVTYSFEGAVIDVGTGYKVVFDSRFADDYAELLLVKDNVNTDGWAGMDIDGNAINGTSAESYAPIVSIGTSALSVPEPTTATLSFAALAGLMLRRRRQA